MPDTTRDNEIQSVSLIASIVLWTAPNMCFLILFLVNAAVAEEHPSKKYQIGEDSYIDAYIQTHNLNKIKINREINVGKGVVDGQHEQLAPKHKYGPPDPGYDYGPPKEPYGPPRFPYGPPAQPHYAPPPDLSFGIPYGYGLLSFFDHFKFKLELLTILKLLLKLVLFKKFVSFVGIICLLLFIPWIKEKKYGHHHNGGGGGEGDGGGQDEEGDEMRVIKYGGDGLNNITVYVLEAIQKYAEQETDDGTKSTRDCKTLYCTVNRIAKKFNIY